MTNQERKAQDKEQNQKWEAIEKTIGNAFTAQPKPDVKILRYYIEHIEEVRPAFRPTLARMVAHPDCY